MIQTAFEYLDVELLADDVITKAGQRKPEDTPAPPNEVSEQAALHAQILAAKMTFAATERQKKKQYSCILKPSETLQRVAPPVGT